MQHTVIGIFRSSGEANTAVERLRAGGFSEQDIDISSRDTTTDVHTESTTPYSVNDESRYDRSQPGSYTTSDETLSEDRSRERRDSDSDFGDSIGRFFRNLFDNKEEAEKYSSVSRRNHVVSVYADTSETAERAAGIMDECGAINLDDDTDSYSATGKYTDTETETFADTRSAGTTPEYDKRRDSDDLNLDQSRDEIGPDNVNERSIPVIQENLNIGKREVEQGGVRLRSRIIERPVEERVRLREERVFVERNPVNRPATEEDFANFKEGELEVTERSEVPIVNKEARVVEEVRLTKDVTERDEVVGDTVRSTDVEVENLNKEEVQSRRKRK